MTALSYGRNFSKSGAPWARGIIGSVNSVALGSISCQLCGRYVSLLLYRMFFGERNPFDIIQGKKQVFSDAARLVLTYWTSSEHK